VGDEAFKFRGILNLNYPIASGIVQNWKDVEKIWAYTFFNKLKVDPSEVFGVLLTEPPMSPLVNRESMMEVMFEVFEVQRFYVAVSAVMSMYAYGRTTGLVVDAGEDVSHIVPVFEGFTISHAIEKMDIAGRVLTSYL
jgi:actin, other eukaryote